MHEKIWSGDVWYKPKLILPYVRLNLTKSQRSMCAQLCSGTLPLAIETGGFNGLPQEDRLCILGIEPFQWQILFVKPREVMFFSDKCCFTTAVVLQVHVGWAHTTNNNYYSTFQILLLIEHVPLITLI